MKEKQGFTLIELLAVIVILAVIALISTPLIMGTIEKAKVNAYKDTIYGILKAGENYAAEELLNGHYTGETLDLSKESKLAYKGTKPKEGSLDILSNGDMALFIKNGQYCYEKRRNTNEIEVIKNAKECSIRVAKNLIQNGYGEYGDNTNFSQFIYQDGYFRIHIKKDARPTMDGKAPVSPKKKYQLSVQARAGMPLTPNFLGFKEFDIDGKEIQSHYVMYRLGSTTKLAKDLKKGDTVIYLENANGFLGYDNSYFNGVIFWDYKDSTGYLYPKETYSRSVYLNVFLKNAIDKTNHTITLKIPWAGDLIKAGTELSQANQTGTFNYGLLSSGPLDTTFKKYSTTMTDVSSAGVTDKKFRYGVSSIQFMSLLAYELKDAVTYVDFKEVVLEEVE